MIWVTRMDSLLTNITSLTDLLTGVGTMITALAGVFAAISVIVKPIRKKVGDWIVNNISRAHIIDQRLENFDNALGHIQTSIDGMKTEIQNIRTENQIQNESIELIKHANIDEMKHTLTEMYYQAKKDNGISRYNRTNFVTMFETYSKLGGNSYVHELYDQILEMPILDD